MVKRHLQVANERERLINGFNSEDNSRDITWLFVKASRTMCIRQPVSIQYTSTLSIINQQTDQQLTLGKLFIRII